MTKRAEKLPPLERGILDSFCALDTQIARDQQKSPKEVSEEGIQKWSAYESKVEQVTELLLEYLGEQSIELDGLLVMAQATAKSLSMLVSDLGREGLGKVRSGYCIDAAEKISRDCTQALGVLQGVKSLN